MSKYKYYFKKPTSEIANDILKTLALIGMVVIAANSPYFFIAVWKDYKRWKHYPKRRFCDHFRRLLNRGYIKMERDGYDLKISLTPKGKQLARWMQIDDLKIKKPKKWDRKWRVVMFDISELKRKHRDAFRWKLKDLGFRYIQKSAWIYPYECRDEIELLKSFFGLKSESVIMFTASQIDNEEYFRELFKL